MMNKIDKFSGEFRFLSNFYEAPFTWRGRVWPTSEHAFQAAKTENPKEQKQILKAKTPAEAKKLGRLVKLRKDWESVKIDTMREILNEKFSQNPDLKDELLDTEDAQLIEGNTWKDDFWGVYEGKGQNWLGILLMELRKKLKKSESEQELVIFSDEGSIDEDPAILGILNKYSVEIMPEPGAGFIVVKGSKKEIDRIKEDGLPKPFQFEDNSPVFAL